LQEWSWYVSHQFAISRYTFEGIDLIFLPLDCMNPATTAEM